MKQFYSEFHFDYEKLRSHGWEIDRRGMSSSELQGARNRIIDDAISHARDIEDNARPPQIVKINYGLAGREDVGRPCIPSTAAEVSLANGGGTHYFIETEELALLLINLVKDETPPASVLDVFHETRLTAFIIHPPSPRPAVLVGIFTDADQTCGVFKFNSARGLGKNEIFDYIPPEEFLGERTSSKIELHESRLVYGLALYARFFPEAIKDGLPESCKSPNHYRGKKAHTISLTPKLIERRGSKSHIRKCHWRFLESARFVNKRNTYVLVKEVFVAGQCKTVTEVEK